MINNHPTWGTTQTGQISHPRTIIVYENPPPQTKQGVKHPTPKVKSYKIFTKEITNTLFERKLTDWNQTNFCRINYNFADNFFQ